MTFNEAVVIGRDSDTGTLLIHCIDGVVIEVPRGGEISVDESGHGTVTGCAFGTGVPDTVPPWFG